LPDIDTARISLDGAVVTAPPPDPKRWKEFFRESHGAYRAWLEQFAAFCETCDGFEVN
jgi:hypothetical protein